MKKLLFISLINLFVFNLKIKGQTFQNGDLEGVITGLSNLPPFWTSISFTDINCQAIDNGGATPDLIDSAGPLSSVGIAGYPFAGNTFIGGVHGVSVSSGTPFHEGIQQSVSGFIPGTIYHMSFYQTIVKSNECRDTSGSWMVVIDDSIVGISIPSSSQEPFNSLMLPWENRFIEFTATLNTHLIKFLPMDDDTVLLSSVSDLNGCLYMGLDYIQIQTVFTDSKNNLANEKRKFMYPNPSNGRILIKTGLDMQESEVIIFNSFGAKMSAFNLQQNTMEIDISNYSNGIYYVVIRNDSIVLKEKLIKI
jgi:hypothetical protein